MNNVVKFETLEYNNIIIPTANENVRTRGGRTEVFYIIVEKGQY